ncbi:MAG: hypothetical protein SNJ70_07260 [Armatimonadota bacterium]
MEKQKRKQRKTQNKATYILIAVLVIFAITIAIATYSSKDRSSLMFVDDSETSIPKNVVSAPSAEPPTGNVLNSPIGKNPPDDLALKDREKPDPSQELIDYLEFVKGVEAHRQKLLRDTARAQQLMGAGGQAQALLSMINWAMNPDGRDAIDPLADAKNELSRQHKNWEDMLRYYDKRIAPPEAREFSGLYRKVIVNQTAAIGAIAISFRNVNLSNIEDLQRLLSELQEIKADKSIQESIDNATEKADNALDSIVAFYDFKEKPFKVEKEKPGSSIINL